MTSNINNESGTNPKAELETILNNGGILLDVRTIDEFEEGHGARALHIPLDRLPFSLDELDKDTPIVVVCQSGIRSHSAASFLIHNGYTKVYDGKFWYEFLD